MSIFTDVCLAGHIFCYAAKHTSAVKVNSMFLSVGIMYNNVCACVYTVDYIVSTHGYLTFHLKNMTSELFLCIVGAYITKLASAILNDAHLWLNN